jgi:hypothetical protein
MCQLIKSENNFEGNSAIPCPHGTLIKVIARTTQTQLRARLQITGIKKAGHKKKPHGANHVA